MIKSFPNVKRNFEEKGEDNNPGVRLFGRRFHADQTNIELLIEFFLVGISKKKYFENNFDTFLPPENILGQMKNAEVFLMYAPKARLNLKLFSFFGASKIDSRHETHRKHLEELDEALKMKIFCDDNNLEDVVQTLEHLFLGFHGVGLQRTWCAQSFLPLFKSTIASEVIWNESEARRKNPEDWNYIMQHYQKFFSINKHLFLARGGEILYLQVCNALLRTKKEINEWLENNDLNQYLSNEEKDPSWLHSQLNAALDNIFSQAPPMVSKIAEFIDQVVEPETANLTDGKSGSERWTKCGWCADETWKEGYLFAVELLRICQAHLDPLDRIDLLQTACALQVIRTLFTQSSRYSGEGSKDTWPACRIAFSEPSGKNMMVKRISQSTVQAISKTIYDGLRNKALSLNTEDYKKLSALYEEADKRYGYKLFLTIGKRLGLIVPKRGSGLRFVLNSQILKFLIVILAPKGRITYDTFKRAAEAHFGFCFDEDALARANSWATGVTSGNINAGVDDWLVSMLEEAGCLRRLSDSCALVENATVVKFREG